MKFNIKDKTELIASPVNKGNIFCINILYDKNSKRLIVYY